MIIETKEVVLLNKEEQEALDIVKILMCEILEQTNDTKLQAITTQIRDELEAFCHVIE